MIRTALGVLLTASAAFAQAEPKTTWDVDAKLAAIDPRLAEFAKLGFDPRSPAPDGDLADLRKRTAAATTLLDGVRNDIARLQAAAQDEVDAKAKAVNEDVRRFAAVNSYAASNMAFLDKLATDPRRGALEPNRDAYATSWDTFYGPEFKRYRLAELEPHLKTALTAYLPDAAKTGYAPHGVTNPYTGDYAARFFDETGDLRRDVWTAGVEAWKKYQADAKGTAERLRARGAEIEKKARALDQQFTAYEAKVKAFETVVGKASDKVNRADLVGAWKGQLTQGTNKVGVTLKIEADGTITNTAENGLSGRGTWRRSGDTLTVVWATGERANWTLKDGKLSGGGTTGRGEKWSIEFTKQ
jgi:hypothetical protein